MVAQLNGSGGDRAPKRTPATVLNPGDVVRVLTANSTAPCVIVAVLYEYRLHGWFVLYRIASGTVELLIDPANVVLVGEATTAPAHGPMCECGGNTGAADVEPEPTPTRTITIAWVPIPGTEHGSVSADGRFEITQPAAGTHQFVACDLWTGERAIIYDRLPVAMDWCEARRDGQRLAWKEAGSGFGASLAGASYRVNCEGTGQFQGVDCRFAVSHRLRRSPIFDSPEAAQRWCAVRAACRVEGEGASAELRYVGPIPF